ncbi:MAG: putative FmdB family regulatory protein [Gammaproteobacteria bacterium]|jgi:putative FmdB family regulatory protein
MPIYEYDCGACDHQFETIRKFSDAPLTRCPSCGEDSLTKRISKVAFRLKGTGWYETDFKDKPKGASGEKSEGNSSSSSDGKSDVKSDSKTNSATKETSSGESKSSSSAESTSKPTTKSAET